MRFYIIGFVPKTTPFGLLTNHLKMCSNLPLCAKTQMLAESDAALNKFSNYTDIGNYFRTFSSLFNEVAVSA